MRHLLTKHTGTNMTEPTSSGVAALAAGKFALSTGIGAALAALVVMLFTMPRSKLEWAQALICTFICSIAGGSFVIVQYSLLAKVDEGLLGAMAVGGLYFACGLPGWALIRWVFNWMAKREGQDIAEVAKDAAETLRDVRR